MRRETADLIGSGLLFAALLSASVAVLAPELGAGTALVGSGSRADPTVDRGRALFYAKGCAVCHQAPRIESDGVAGPDLHGLATRAGTRRPGMAAEAYVAESIGTPAAFIAPGAASGASTDMPDLQLREDEIQALVAFLLHAP